jgi:hypothetical protein
MLYEIATGRLPYSDTNGLLPSQEQLRDLILNEPPEPPRRIRASISHDLAAIIEKAMARDAEARYLTMEDLAEDLRAFLEIRPVTARRPTPAIRLQKWARRNSAYVAFGSLAFTLVASSALVALRLKAQKDQARQLTSLRQADLAARSGRWRDVLSELAQAESSGYRDTIPLSLQRMEAWDALGQKSRMRAELDKLLHLADPGKYRAIISLKAGEYELFGSTTSQQGIQHVRAALSAGLDPADAAYARGLVAETVPDSLTWFRKALDFNPYHLSAHRLSLGLELILSRRAELESHLRVFKVLFPDEPSAILVEAAQLALSGQAQKAQALMTGRPDTSAMQETGLVLSGFQYLGTLVDYLDLDVKLGDRKATSPELDARLTSLMLLTTAMSPSASSNSVSDVRLVQLPCVKSGIEKLIQLGIALSFGKGADGAAPVAQIKDAWKHFPEGVLPYLAAVASGNNQPPDPDKFRIVLENQAELLQLAEDSPSVFPKLGRIARYYAILTEAKLIDVSPPPAITARTACISTIRRSLASSETSASECRSYLEIALQLHDVDLARQILFKWNQLAPANREVAESRVRLETETGAIGSALALLDQMLAENPSDTWAFRQRQAVTERLQTLAKDNPTTYGAKP